MRRGVTGCYATTIVSSTMLRALCAARGQRYAETLTGFKWIVRAACDGGAAGSAASAGSDPDGLVFGYEEALGYCVAPNHVRDKDGITAALLVAELAAGLKTELRSLTDRLDELALEFGVYATDQVAIRVRELREITEIMAALRAKPPTLLLDEPVSEVADLAPGADVVIVRSSSARVVVRPSGTEPKLKAYLEVVEPVTAGDPSTGPTVDDVPAARERAAAELAALRTEVTAALGR